MNTKVTVQEVVDALNAYVAELKKVGFVQSVSPTIQERIQAHGIAHDGAELLDAITAAFQRGFAEGKSEGITPPDGMVLVPLSEFPLFDDNGLDEVAHHCEWSMQQDRKRIHACAAAPKQEVKP